MNTIIEQRFNQNIRQPWHFFRSLFEEIRRNSEIRNKKRAQEGVSYNIVVEGLIDRLMGMRQERKNDRNWNEKGFWDLNQI